MRPAAAALFLTGCTVATYTVKSPNCMVEVVSGRQVAQAEFTIGKDCTVSAKVTGITEEHVSTDAIGAAAGLVKVLIP